jgi:hypothetical protein
MRSWKSVLASLLFAYLILATTSSLAVRYAATTTPTAIGRHASPVAAAALVTEPGCVVAQARGEAAGFSPVLPTDGNSIGLNDSLWDFSQSDGLPSYGPMRPCDEHGS